MEHAAGRRGGRLQNRARRPPLQDAEGIQRRHGAGEAQPARGLRHVHERDDAGQDRPAASI